MNQKKIKSLHLGFDQAIVNTGISVMSYDGQSTYLDYLFSELFSSTFKWGQKSDSFILLEQAAHLKETLNKYSNIAPIKSISIEGVSFGSPGGASSRGAVWGLFVTTCLNYADVIVVAPKSLKLFSTGNGSADKKEMASVIYPKYNLESLDRKVWDDEIDAIGLSEVGFWASRIMDEGVSKIKDKLKPHELIVLWNEKLNTAKKPMGICNRLDDFYLRKIGN